MQKIAKITGKRQLTIPSKIFREIGLKEGNNVIVSNENGIIKIEPALNLVKRLAGSVSIPSKFKKMSVDQIIYQAKKEYFNKRH